MKAWIYGAACTLLSVIVLGCGSSTSGSPKAEADSTAAPDTAASAALPTTEEGMYEAAQKAENASRPRDAIKLYRKILAEYPESENAYKAQFLIGFVFSEEMSEPDSAKAAFETVLKKYPNSEFADDAQAMLSFIDGKMPEFQESPPK